MRFCLAMISLVVVMCWPAAASIAPIPSTRNRSQRVSAQIGTVAHSSADEATSSIGPPLTGGATGLLGPGAGDAGVANQSVWRPMAIPMSSHRSEYLGQWVPKVLFQFMLMAGMGCLRLLLNNAPSPRVVCAC